MTASAVRVGEQEKVFGQPVDHGYMEHHVRIQLRGDAVIEQLRESDRGKNEPETPRTRDECASLDIS